MQVGIYRDIPNAEYHHGPGESKSLLDLVHRSPAHYRARKDSKNDNTPTAAQAIGTAFHSLLLEPNTFGDQYVTIPENAPKKPTSVQRNAAKPSPATVDAITWWDIFEERNAGKTIISADDNEQLAAMAVATRAHKAAGALLTGAIGHPEQSAYWIDPDTGLLCRCRPDFWRVDGILVDVKTTEDASPEEFARSIAKYRYHVQAAFYLDGVRETILQANEELVIPEAFVFLAVEKKAPFAVATYVLTPEAIELGRREYKADLKRIAECTAADEWPAYSQKIEQIELPAWYMARAAA